MLSLVAAPILLASAALAHVQINYPLGQRVFEEETQETGAFCGGGSYSNASAWGAQDAFISLSGDAGQQITVLWTTGSTSSPASVSSSSDFDSTLLANATFPSSGNFCFNVSLPEASSLDVGTIGTLYVQAVGNGANVSSCADVAVIPTLSVAQTPVISADGQQVISPETGSVVSYYDYYCSNSTILALDTCSCHCHGDHGHCTDTCSEARVEEANAQCKAEAAGGADSCDCHCHGDHGHCSEACSEERVAESNAQCAAASSSSSSLVPSAAASSAAAGASQSAEAAAAASPSASAGGGTSGALAGVQAGGAGPLVAAAAVVGLVAVLL